MGLKAIVRRVSLPTLAAVLLSSTPLVHADNTRAEIEAFDAEMAAAANRGDNKAIAALCTADAEIFEEGSAPIKGRAAIEAASVPAPEPPWVKLSPTNRL
jgi:hypothetical protein